MRPIILCLALSIPSICVAQNATNPQQTPTQRAFFVKQETYRTTGTAVLSAEHAREEVQACPSGLDPDSINLCLDSEFKITQKNYQSYIKALSGLLRLGSPDIPNLPGTAKEFEKAELSWTAYRDTQCRTASNVRPGAIQGYLYLTCEQNLTRSHMVEIANLYADLW